MPLSIVATLVRNLVMVPAAVLRSRAAKDAEVLALRHENAVLRRQVARARYEPADRIWFAIRSGQVARARYEPADRIWFAIRSLAPALARGVRIDTVLPSSSRARYMTMLTHSRSLRATSRYCPSC